MKNTNRPLVYLACPYTHDNPAVMEERFQKVNKTAANLTLEGYCIFSPISMCHSMAQAEKLPVTWEFWEKFDRKYLSCCNKLIVLALDGWETSVGVSAEIEIANEMGIPVEIMEEE